jgi:hypothetical protein
MHIFMELITPNLIIIFCLHQIWIPKLISIVILQVVKISHEDAIEHGIIM